MFADTSELFFSKNIKCWAFFPESPLVCCHAYSEENFIKIIAQSFDKFEKVSIMITNIYLLL